MRVGRGTSLIAALASVVACARALPPPGGDPDELPPEVLVIQPAPGTLIAPTDEAVVIEFNERISEQDLERAVVVSPVTGAVQVDKGRQELEVSVAGGWQPGYVYRVTVRPLVRDLFGNVIPEPIEFAFSTGPDFPDAAIAGAVYDRITAQPIDGARVEARPVGGGAYHLAFTDTAGVFTMPLVPPGDYLLRAYLDQNRDRRRQEFEAADSVVVSLAQADTVLHAFALMQPDSAPARLTLVEAIDSLAIQLSFDDYMDPRQPQEDARVMVWRLPDSTAVPVLDVLYPEAYATLIAARDSARADSARADGAVVDSARADRTVVDSARVDAAPVPEVPAERQAVVTRQGIPRDVGPDTMRVDSARVDSVSADPLRSLVLAADLLPPTDSLLPTRMLVVRLAAPLEVGVRYRVRVSGVVNLAGVPGGGGTAILEVEAEALLDEAEQAAAEAEAAPEAEAGEEADPGVETGPGAEPMRELEPAREPEPAPGMEPRPELERAPGEQPAP